MFKKGSNVAKLNLNHQHISAIFQFIRIFVSNTDMIAEMKINVSKLKDFHLAIALIFITSFSFGQKNAGTVRMEKVSCPEKWWAVFHPFIVKKAFTLTKDVLKATDSIQRSDVLDGDISGGQVDAFKHSYWMALLVQHIRWQKAWKLGKAHEKGNFKSFKRSLRHDLENHHDKASSEMDLWNDKEGIKTGLRNLESEEMVLQSVIIHSILKGKMRIIKKNKKGLFLDAQGNIIPQNELKGKWENDKCLVPSDWAENMNNTNSDGR